MNEIWKDVVGYEGYYQVSNFGNVRTVAKIIKRGNGSSFPVKSKYKVFHQNKKTKYLYVALVKDNKTINHLLHRIVAIAFIENPHNKRTVNHKDGNKSNNRVSNLEWCTYSENAYHSYRELGRVASLTGKTPHNAKKVIDNQTGKIYPSIRQAADDLMVSDSYIQTRIYNNSQRFAFVA
jgi:hypothetical protein